MVLFWASWCPYCKALMPRLSQLAAPTGMPIYALRIADHPPPPVPLPDGVRDFPAGDDVAAHYGVTMVPALFVVDAEGQIIYRLDYPPDDHPSQQLPHGKAQAAMLADWWETRIAGVLAESAGLNEGATDQ